MSGNQAVIKVFEYALNQEETGKKVFPNGAAAPRHRGGRQCL
ncbi:MAG: hypothetical protein ACUVSA_13045 [Desulfosoma sp.]